MSLDEKMTLWNSKSGVVEPDMAPNELFQGIVNDSEGEESEGGDEFKLVDKVKLPAYNNVILSSLAYKWFISNLRRECSFHWDEKQPRTMVRDIRKRILARLPVGIISKRNTPRRHWAEFRLPRPRPEACLLRQSRHSQATSSGGPQISKILTATGTTEQAQIATVREYFNQTWPSSGPETLAVLQHAIDGAGVGGSGWCSGILRDKSQLIAPGYWS